MMNDKDVASRSNEREANDELLHTGAVGAAGFEEQSVGPLTGIAHGGGSGDDGENGDDDQGPGADASQLAVAASELSGKGQKVKAALRARLGEDVYTSWFASLDFASYEDRCLKVTVPVKFLQRWIQSHYAEALRTCAAREFTDIEHVEVLLRQPNAVASKQPSATSAIAPNSGRGNGAMESGSGQPRTGVVQPPPRQQVNGLECSPLDPRYTFDSFVVGLANRMAHAGAVQVAETVLIDQRGFNPLFIHSSVGHGKSHLLQAIAWEARRRTPHAKVLYLTAERFRFAFVEAVKAQDAMAFKDRFRAIDMLLIDDLEFMTGEKTELEFDHIINMLLDSGRKLVVASARPPAQLTKLNERMRSRLQRGLVTELGSMDAELRAKIVERRVAERRANDPSFELPRNVIELVADRLTESGRELEGAVNRLYAQWQLQRSAITREAAEVILKDLVSNGDSRRIRIEDIQRVVSRHYGVSKNDLLSERRHRSVVWPRQIGMFLAKQMTARSLPEIGRRFGNRDHTTVLHAIRKIEGKIPGDAQLKDEIEELKRQLGPDMGGNA